MTLERIIGQFEAYTEYPDTYALISNRECRDILKYLTQAPKPGRWIGIEYDGYADENPVYDVWECSKCGWEHNGEEDTLTCYCPNCGAMMESEE